MSTLRVVFFVRVYRRIYELIVGVIFTRQFYDQFYWIGLSNEFMC